MVENTMSDVSTAALKESKITEKSESTCACCEKGKIELHNADSLSSYEEIMKL
jgi:predicted methyltransferase